MIVSISRAKFFVAALLLSMVLIRPLSWAVEIRPTSAGIKTSDLISLTQSLNEAIVSSERPFYGIILLVQGGEIIYQRQQGGDGMETPDNNRYFLLASQSKMVTAALVLQAVDEGRVLLEQTLNHYLRLASQPLYHQDITIKQLLSHTSGISPIGQNNRFVPGSQFQYSNLGYEMLAKVLEIMYQQPFSEQVNLFLSDNGIEGILAQLGPIKATSTSHYKDVQGMKLLHDGSSVAVDYDITSDLLPAGGLLGSAKGLSQFLQALHGSLLLPKDLYQAMVTPVIKRDHRWPELYYGYGVQINQQQLTEYSHSGYLPGFQSLSLSYPQSETYLVVLENSSWPIDDMDKAFGLQDRLRLILRKHLIAARAEGEINPK